ncbi:hypothetical protein BpHYR1_019768 [Brachionus plicatilis]|uniref:Uncharacterized protein n=1 Tax=Brachionus plicatilis TaxID=10195 RepID=A0A3M7PPH8_BRAPC|nr:hypothetical protein BpHYR1_019768 [Brachionus plicatilis]
MDQIKKNLAFGNGQVADHGEVEICSNDINVVFFLINSFNCKSVGHLICDLMTHASLKNVCSEFGAILITSEKLSLKLQNANEVTAASNDTILVLKKDLSKVVNSYHIICVNIIYYMNIVNHINYLFLNETNH